MKAENWFKFRIVGVTGIGEAFFFRGAQWGELEPKRASPAFRPEIISVTAPSLFTRTNGFEVPPEGVPADSSDCFQSGDAVEH